MAGNKYSHSFEIALSAISCAIAVVCLLVGIFSQYLLASGYLFAMCALMLPLSKKFYFGNFLAYLGTVILAIVLGAVMKFWDIVPFIIFFGLHPLANSLQLKFKINKYIALIVKTIWFDLTLLVSYLILGYALFGGDLSGELYDFINKYIYFIIFIGGSILFFPYDYLMFQTQITVDKLVYRIRK